MLKEQTLNPHCSEPFISKEKHRWCIQFWYYENNKRKPYKNAFDLNSADYIKKLGKGIFLEVNKNERKQYANQLLISVKEALKNQKFITETKSFQSANLSDFSFRYWCDEFILHLKSTKKSGSTIGGYESNFRMVHEYIAKKYKRDLAIKEIDIDFVSEYLSYKSKDWNSGHAYNNNLSHLKALMAWLTDFKKVFSTSPLKQHKSIEVDESDQHEPYPPELAVKVLDTAKAHSKELYLLFLTTYYTLSRPAEILKLQKKNFDLKNNQILFYGKNVKTKKRKYSKLHHKIIEFIAENVDLKSIPDDWYFLGYTEKKEGRTGEYYMDIFAPHKSSPKRFNSRFEAVRRQLKLDRVYTIYGWKHTGVVRLKQVGWTNEKIMLVTGHTKESTLGIYARRHSVEIPDRYDDVESGENPERMITIQLSESEFNEIIKIKNPVVKIILERAKQKQA